MSLKYSEYFLLKITLNILLYQAIFKKFLYGLNILKKNSTMPDLMNFRFVTFLMAVADCYWGFDFARTINDAVY